MVERNLCDSHGAGVCGGSKPLGVSTWFAWRGVGGRVGCLSLTISQEVEIETVCVVTVSYLPSLGFATSSPGPGWEVRSWIGWTPLGKSECLAGEGCTVGFPCSWRLAKERVVPTAWSLLAFLVFLLIYAGHSTALWPQNWWAVLVTAL